MLRATMMDFPLTLRHVVDRVETLFAHVPIVGCRPDGTLLRTTWGETMAFARRLAAALQRLGLRRGEPVATLMWNHPVHLAAYYGIPLAGGVLHTLNLRLHPDELAYIVGHARDRFLLLDDVLLPLYLELQRRGAAPPAFVVRWNGTPDRAGLPYLDELLADARADTPLPELAETDPLSLCYTSGTTGRPKGVVYSHRSVLLHSFAWLFADSLGLRNRDVLLPAVPMFHVNGWGLPYTSALVGARLVLPGRHLDPVSLLELLAGEQVTVATGVTTIWLGVLEELTRHPERWPLRLRTILIGGTPVPEHLIRAFAERYGTEVLQCWGMTETSPLATAAYLPADLADAPLEDQVRYRAKHGRPLPFVEIRARNDDGLVPWDGATMGELEVRGPWVAAAYHHAPDTADRWTPDGWFRTGDIVTIDPQGTVELRDRAKDLVKSGGEWISSVALENALMGHPSVAEAAVIAAAHPTWQERPVAVVVPRPGAAIDEAALRAHLAARFPSWWLPDAFVVVDALPKTSTGKFAKTELRARYGDILLGSSPEAAA